MGRGEFSIEAPGHHSRHTGEGRYPQAENVPTLAQRSVHAYMESGVRRYDGPGLGPFFTTSA